MNKNDAELIPIGLKSVSLKQTILKDMPMRDIRNGLVFQSDFDTFSGNDIKDQSGGNADLTIDGAIKAAGPGSGLALSFDGTDDFCKQKVYDTQQSTVRVVTINGGAVLWDFGQDFSNFVGAAGVNKDYMAVVKDAENEVGWGYIGEEGAGTTVIGSELMTNGNMETGDPPTSWTVVRGTVSSDSSVVHGGSASMKIVHSNGDATTAVISANMALTVGTLYRLVFWYYNVNETNIYYQVHDQVSAISTAPYTTKGAWTKVIVHFHATNTEDHSIRLFSTGTPSGNGVVYFDDVSVKEVTIGETLGAEKVVNGDFAAWTSDDPDDWTVAGESESDPEVSQVGTGEGHGGSGTGMCNMYCSDGTLVSIEQTILTVGKLYKYSIDIDTLTDGQLAITMGTGAVVYFAEAGTKTGYMTATATVFTVKRYEGAGANDITFDNVSVKEVTGFPADESIKLYSTKAGSTQNLAGEDANFDSNDTLTYEVRKTDFQITGPFSIGCWFKNATHDLGVMAKADSADDDLSSFSLYGGGAAIVIRILSGATGYVASVAASAYYNDVWHFVVGVYLPSTYVKLYIDGAEVASNTSGIPASINDVFEALIVGHSNTGVAGTYPHNGLMSRPFIYNRALLAAEMRQLYYHSLVKYGLAR